MHETPKAAAAFEEYCAMEERSLRHLANKTGTKLSQLGVWSSEHNWQERVKQYDHERAEEKRRKRDAEIEKMNERHAMIGTIQQARAIKQIEALIEAKKFGSQATVMLLKLATDLERLARGESTQRMEQMGTIGISGQVGFYPVQLPEKEEHPGATVELPEKGGDANENANKSKSDDARDPG